MTQTAERLKAELSLLNADDRAELAEFLLGSLDGEPDPAVEAAWNMELGRRVEEIRSGAVQGIPAENVFARIRSRTR